MVKFDNFGGLTTVLKFHIFLIFNCEELVRIRVVCEGLVRFFSDVKNCYAIFTNVKNRTSSSQLKSVNNRVMLRSYAVMF